MTKQKCFGWFMTVLLLLVCCLPANAQDKRPNVLLIYCDDVGYADISAYSHAASDTQTPQINRIAERGVLFTQGYAASPICNVSRVAVTTGRYPQSTGSRWYGGPGLTKVQRGTTLAEQLQASGYRTVSIGKHHFGGVGEPKNTDKELRHARANPVNHGFDEFFGFIHSEKDYARNTQAELDVFIEGATAQGVSTKDAATYARQAVVGPMIRATRNNGSPTFQREDRVGYTTDIFTDEAIAQFGAAEKPMFVAVNYNALHTQLWNAVPEHYKEGRGITAQEEESYSPKAYDGVLPFWTFNHKFAWFTPGEGEDQLGDINDPRDTPANRFRRKLYLAALDHLDDNIGRLLDALETNGQLENTIVVFTGDNGGSHNIGADNSPLTGHKYMLGEGGIRVPYIVSWIGNGKGGRVVDDAVSHMDLTDTVLSAAGSKNAARTDGRDLSGLIAGKADQDYRTQYWDSGNDRVVRHGNWKLRVITAQRAFPNFNESPGTFLYRLDNDPGEHENLAKEHSGIVAALTQLHQAWADKQYQAGPMFRDNSMVVNGSFEHTDGVNQRAAFWHHTADVDEVGATLGGALQAGDGLWRAYLRGGAALWQITEHEIEAGDQLKLRFSVNTAGFEEQGVLAQLIVSNDAGEYEKLDWTVRAMASDMDAGAWQSYEAVFIAEQGKDYIGKKVGVLFCGIGPDGYRALDDVSLMID